MLKLKSFNPSTNPMTKSGWPKRLHLLDISRGIASLSVVLWHWKLFYNINKIPSLSYQKDSQPFYTVLKLFYDNGSIGVDYFFMLSGFIFFWLYQESIKNKETDSYEFAVNRFSRLYPLHFITLTSVAVLQYFYILKEGNSYAFPYNDGYHYVLNLLFASKWGFEKGLSFNAPVWSVSVEILLYAVFFLVAFLRLGKFSVVFFISITAFCLSVIFYNDIIKGISMFFLGGGLYHLIDLYINRYKKLDKYIAYSTVLLWIIVFINTYIFNFCSGIKENIGIGSIALKVFPNLFLFPLTIISLVSLEIKKKSGWCKSLSWVGDITYATYLLHFPLQLVFVLFVAHKILTADFYINQLYWVIYFIILIGLSYITFHKFEKPLQNLLRKKLLSKRFQQRNVFN